MSNSISSYKASQSGFLTDDFLLNTEPARRLYHEYAKDMPIIDFHCHLPAEQIATNYTFDNLTEIWLKGDHYKWRAMRALGVDEQYITGLASDREKFFQWAKIVPYVMRNPLYHWTHMELKNPFGVNQNLSGENAHSIYDYCTELLQKEYSTQRLLNHFKVEVVGTTDDPCDSLEFHRAIKGTHPGYQVAPTFRPDQALNIEVKPGFQKYIQQLSSVSNVVITSFDTLLEALKSRHDLFDEMGCRASDHGQTHLYAADYTLSEVNSIFIKGLEGQELDDEQVMKFKSAVQYELALLDWARGWVQQFHLGAIRNNNSRLLTTLGKDIGVDSMGDYLQMEMMSRFFNRLDQENKLAKTVIYNVNPSQNESFATMAGNFQDGTLRGKMQWGSAWWFLDQKDGMIDQINVLSNMGVLSTFIGMITDSRSFLSFPRHEYFRRILCQLFGQDIVNGELPNDLPWIGKIIQDISYHNAKQFFGF